MERMVFTFNEGDKGQKMLLGGKGANLAEMTRIGLPVPKGFTITTTTCNEYYNRGAKLWADLKKEIKDNLRTLEENTNKTFGGANSPLLLSVRSGAAVSMPGMMDTILNLGLTDISVEALIKESNDPIFALDSYRRFIQMYSDVVMNIPKYKFDMELERILKESSVETTKELNEENIRRLVTGYKRIFLTEVGMEFPIDPLEQLYSAIDAVFKSWNNPRAKIYREINDIDGSIGTAVNIQSMVFGNLGLTSGTGVAFTRNPSSGDRAVFGEYLLDAQGEDVVAGIRTPKDIEALKNELPEVYDEFKDVCVTLENHYKDVQDIEFTIENKKLYLLQTRNAKRTAKASIKIAVDLVKEGVISKEEAIMRIDTKGIGQLLHKTFDEKVLNSKKPLVSGLPASPGAASGRIAFSSEDIKAGRGEVLVRVETSPEDIEGMNLADGILTINGGMTSHAAVVARGMGRCCVSGCSSLSLDEANGILEVGDMKINKGDIISIDGSTGNVYLGEIPRVEVSLDEDFNLFMGWVDQYREMGVRVNADTVEDSKTAIKFGAEGIGLCRTEHMFFEEKKIWPVREMIVAKNELERTRALNKIKPLQKEDFKGIFNIMDGKSVTIRLLDPPLHEFIPHDDKGIKEMSTRLGLETREVEKRVEALKEFNPMLGHRGCRLGISYPEIYEMQVSAIVGAANECVEEGIDVRPEIMIPLVGDIKELAYLRERVEGVIAIENKASIDYKIGTMIEVPRACITADKIASKADFFSFGTNDLTQITYGFSRDDSPKFIRDYKEKDILSVDPFESIDVDGVGELIREAIKRGRATKADLKIGVCGEQGGDPRSIEFFKSVGLDYVSCSPYRLVAARLAVAQSEIKNR